LFPDASFMPFVLSAVPYKVGDAWQILAYATDASGGNASANNDIWAARSSDGTTPFTLLNGGAPVIGRMSCNYCEFSVWFPSLLVEDQQYLAFFGAAHCNKPGGCMGINDGVSMSIGRARSSDGTTFTPEAAPVLSGDMGGETYLAAPQVQKDGSIYK